jgi:hypothetical protein
MAGATLQERETAFGESLNPFKETYGSDMLLDFFYYWTEPNKSKTKMKFEMEKTWDVVRRLRTWEKNQINWNRNGKSKQPATETRKDVTDILGSRNY